MELKCYTLDIQNYQIVISTDLGKPQKNVRSFFSGPATKALKKVL